MPGLVPAEKDQRYRFGGADAASLSDPSVLTGTHDLTSLIQEEKRDQLAKCQGLSGYKTASSQDTLVAPA